MTEVLSDFPAGPLDFYRKKASFDWKQLKVFLFGEDEVRYSQNIYNEISKYPEFQPSKKVLTFDEQRRITFRQTAIIRANQNKLYHPKLSMFEYFAPAAQVKLGLGIKLFTGMLEKLGSDRHKPLISDIKDGKISGCFCLTEISHGTNVKGMRTTATYDKVAKQFIINTPDFEAAKCWAGSLGNTATHAVLYAQLYIDGKYNGLHTFVVPIRDPSTLLPYPGVIVGDMGEKIGLNGIDNGFLMLNNYRIPREYLLNHTGDVDEDGQYVTPYEKESKRFGASLLALSATRVEVIVQSEIYGGFALTTAIRYSGVRKQFGINDEEMPILEYQTQQYRLLPYLAAAYVLKSFTRFASQAFEQYMDEFRTDSISLLGIELHVVTSAAKPVSGWIMRDAIQSCREACAGHGYLKAAGIGDLRNNQDATLTYEGENWVLIQQTSNFLLKLRPNILSGVEVKAPLKSVDFLNNISAILKSKFTAKSFEEVIRPESILSAFQWLTCYLLNLTNEKREAREKLGESTFSSRNNTQVFYARKLGIAFIEHFLLQKFLDKIGETSNQSLKAVLLKMFSLYGLFSLEKFTNILYQGGYIAGDAPSILIQDSIIELCLLLKDDAVALVDVIAPPDSLLNSALGASDGQVYHHLQESFFTSPYGTGRPSWWTDITNWKDISMSAKPKL
ncbi:peroxisomal acyl-coenzyme A oxidase 3-like [Euwallacea similis]|uniref:peroxisomal acyl-coenzyme A oxidase 3-like n=1 Tax=Euwallacea similis TaxID=1736056 RepID=UPI00344EDA4D